MLMFPILSCYQIYCRSGPPFNICPVLTSSDSDALVAAFTEQIAPQFTRCSNISTQEQGASVPKEEVGCMNARETGETNTVEEQIPSKRVCRFKHCTLPSLMLMLRIHLKLAAWEQASSTRKRGLITKVGTTHV